MSSVSPGFAFVVFQTVIIIPFFTGTVFRSRMSDPERFTQRLLRINITLIEPLIVLWCVWELKFPVNVVVLPLAGLWLAICGLAAGMLAVLWLGLKKHQSLTFLLSTTLSNHGFTMGGFLCYLLLGEQGLGLAVIMVLYFIPYLYGFIFPSAKALLHTEHQPKLRDYLLDGRNMPLLALAAAAVLNMCNLRRPTVFFPINELLALSIALYYLTVGMNYRTARLRGMMWLHLSLAAIKFIAVPLGAIAFVHLFPVEHEIKSVILLQSCMPAAVYSVVTAVLFNLDAELAASLFVVNTGLFLVLVLPVVWLLAS